MFGMFVVILRFGCNLVVLLAVFLWVRFATH